MSIYNAIEIALFLGHNPKHCIFEMKKLLMRVAYVSHS